MNKVFTHDRGELINIGLQHSKQLEGLIAYSGNRVKRAKLYGDAVIWSDYPQDYTFHSLQFFCRGGGVKWPKGICIDDEWYITFNPKEYSEGEEFISYSAKPSYFACPGVIKLWPLSGGKPIKLAIDNKYRVGFIDGWCSAGTFEQVKRHIENNYNDVEEVSP